MCSFPTFLSPPPVLCHTTSDSTGKCLCKGLYLARANHPHPHKKSLTELHKRSLSQPATSTHVSRCPRAGGGHAESRRRPPPPSCPVPPIKSSPAAPRRHAVRVVVVNVNVQLGRAQGRTTPPADPAKISPAAAAAAASAGGSGRPHIRLLSGVEEFIRRRGVREIERAFEAVACVCVCVFS